jgi:hypothetical protein
MSEKIYVVFTVEGFAQIRSELTHNKAMLWHNSGIISEEDLHTLSASNIPLQELTPSIQSDDDKAILAALTKIELIYPNAEILVEYG